MLSLAFNSDKRHKKIMPYVLSRLKEIASMVLFAIEANELESILQRIAEVSRELTGTRYVALGVPDGKNGLRYFKTAGMTAEEIAMIDHLPHGHGLIRAPMRERHIIRLSRIQDDPRSVGFPANHPEMTSLLGVPVQMGQQLFGVLYLCDKTNGELFNDEDEALVETIAVYAALAIASAEMNQSRNRLALLEERERIGMELHDGVIQSLYGIGMQVELLRLNGNQSEMETLTPVVDALNDVIEDIRNYILELKARGDNQLTIYNCLQQMLLRLHLPPTLSVQVDAPDTRPPFSPAIFESICLIVNEALSNAIRHAHAKILCITAKHDRVWFSVIVEDDGQGFRIEQVQDTGGLGLQHMQRRARLYGGSVDVDTAPGKGTLLTIKIPIRAY
jgi:signal transduction histidine kinase